MLKLSDYRLLGRSGLRVSPLALGTMTFGTEWEWGAEEGVAQRIFDTYIERGGNLIDTANGYTKGTSEKLIGKFIQGRRDQLVVSTKFSFPTDRDPNSGGNHRKSIVGSIHGSLRRLNTDYIDLLFLHAWDNTTPVDEVLRALDDLVRSGKILYIGISNTPAWQISRMQALASVRGWSQFVALQIEYNLLQRVPERELIPMATELGLGVMPWSPLRGGVLSGKYRDNQATDERTASAETGTRHNLVQTSGLLTPRSDEVVKELLRISKDTGRSPSQVAIAWLLNKPGVVAPVLGARTFDQFIENLDALVLDLSPCYMTALDQISKIELGYPHDYLEMMKCRTERPLGIGRRDA